MTRRFDEADDLVQETMVKALRAIDRFRDGSDMRAWLLTILRRSFIDLHRSRKHDRRSASLDDASVPEPAAAEGGTAGEWDERWDDPEGLLDRFEDEQIVESLRSLPDEIRWTLLLVDVERLDQREAAEVLEVPVGTIKSRAHRGRAMLRDKLHSVARRRGWIKVDADAERDQHDG